MGYPNEAYYEVIEFYLYLWVAIFLYYNFKSVRELGKFCVENENVTRMHQQKRSWTQMALCGAVTLPCSPDSVGSTIAACQTPFWSLARTKWPSKLCEKWPKMKRSPFLIWKPCQRLCSLPKAGSLSDYLRVETICLGMSFPFFPATHWVINRF